MSSKVLASASAVAFITFLGSALAQEADSGAAASESDRGYETVLEEVIITNTIPLTPERQLSKMRVLSVAPLLAEAIRRIHDEESVSTLFV